MVSIRTCRDCGCLATELIDGRTWFYPHEEKCPENPGEQMIFFSWVDDPTDFTYEAPAPQSPPAST